MVNNARQTLGKGGIVKRLGENRGRRFSKSWVGFVIMWGCTTEEQAGKKKSSRRGWAGKAGEARASEQHDAKTYPNKGTEVSGPNIQKDEE